MTFDMSDYVDVAERERLFFERYPEGRIQVELDDVRQGDVIVAWKAKATIWRTPDDPIPVCDFAVEPVPGKTPYTRDSEAMNASTSAVGRAIVLAGFPSKKIASADEVMNRSGLGEPQPNGSHSVASPKPELPTISEDAKPSEYVVHFATHRGKRLGDLTKGQLWWFADKWQVQEDPSDYDLRLKAAAVALHSGDDAPMSSVPSDMADVPFA